MLITAYLLAQGRNMHESIITLALEKYFDKKISLGKVAELARISIREFMKMAAEKTIVLNYSVKSLEEDFEQAIK